MTRNLKALGLALMAVFAMSAIAAQAASAQNGIFTTGGTGATLTAENTSKAEPLQNSLTEFGLSIICPNATYGIHKANVTPHVAIPNLATSATITPSYGTCAVSGTGFVGIVDMNGCDYTFFLKGTTGVADEYNVDATVDCPANQHIQITLATNQAQHEGGTYFCKVTVTEKEGENDLYSGLKIKDTTTDPDSADITGTIEGIVAHKEAVAGHAGILCPSATKENGVLHIDVKATATTGTIGISHN